MNQLLKKSEENMKKSLEMLQKEYSEIRAGRANPAIIEKIKIDYYGSMTPINQLAAISITGARTLTIQPWEASVCQQIEKAIQTADVGINPQSDGKVIHLAFPALTEDRRKDIVKEVSAMAETSKIAIRSTRRDALEKLKRMKKDAQISEDEHRKGEKCVQDLTDRYSKEVVELCSKKEKEILEI
jgi:ribosome recycling factor